MQKHKYFDSDLTADKYTLRIDHTESITSDEKRKLALIFNQIGFVVLDCESNDSIKNQLLALRPLFGETFHHTRGDHNNLITISALEQQLPGFIGTSNAPHPLHTDGQYLLDPPKITAIACETQADRGGDSHLFSARLLLECLQARFPEQWHLLFEPDVYCIEREGKTLTRPIFEQREPAQFSMAFRYDETLPVQIKAVAQPLIDALRKILYQADYLLAFKLCPQQILLLDNYALLHGRKGFETGSLRKLHRLVFDGNAEFAKQYLQCGFPVETFPVRC